MPRLLAPSPLPTFVLLNLHFFSARTAGKVFKATYRPGPYLALFLALLATVETLVEFLKSPRSHLVSRKLGDPGDTRRVFKRLAKAVHTAFASTL